METVVQTQSQDSSSCVRCVVVLSLPGAHVELLVWRMRSNAISVHVNGSLWGELATAAAVGTGTAAPKLAVWFSCLQLKDNLQRN